MKLERKFLIFFIVLSLFFGAVAVFGTIQLSKTISDNKADKLNAAKWKKQAGKAYTAMLDTKSGFKNIKRVLPKGATEENGIVYPPDDF